MKLAAVTLVVFALAGCAAERPPPVSDGGEVRPVRDSWTDGDRTSYINGTVLAGVAECRHGQFLDIDDLHPRVEVHPIYGMRGFKEARLTSGTVVSGDLCMHWMDIRGNRITHDVEGVPVVPEDAKWVTVYGDIHGEANYTIEILPWSESPQPP